ncbi:MAG: hypothetical protein ACYCSR_05985 [Thiomonas sp.]
MAADPYGSINLDSNEMMQSALNQALARHAAGASRNNPTGQHQFG